MQEKAKEGTLKAVNGSAASGPAGNDASAQKKRRRWDQQQQSGDETPAKKKSDWEKGDATTPSHG